MLRSFTTILFFLLAISFKSIAEEVQININVQDTPLSEVLNAIAEQSGVRFSYNPQQIDAEKSVSVYIHNKNLQESLKQILPASISTKQRGKYILLLPLTKEDFTAASNEENEGKEINIEKNKEDNLLNFSREKNNLEKLSIPSTGIDIVGCHNNVNLKKEETMKKHLAALAVLTATSITAQVPAQENAQVGGNSQQSYSETAKGEKKPFQFSFVYPLGTDFINSQENTYDISFNLIGGVTGRVEGVELGSVFNINKYCAHGVQFAGAFNLTGYDFTAEEESNAVQFAGAFNLLSSGSATQFAGGANFTGKGFFQAAGGANIGKEEVNAQLAGGLNVAQKSLFQAVGGANIANEANCQLAGGVNLAKNTKAQIAGGINIADKSSFQLATVNITEKGGFQLGVVNVRDTVDGVSIGLLNIVKRGGLCDFGVEGGEFIHTALTFRSGTYGFYSIISAGWNFSEEFWSAGFGFGHGFRFTNWLGLNLELMHHQLYEIHWNADTYNGLVQIRPMLDFRIARHFKVFAGPTANLLIQHRRNGNSFLNTPYKSFYNTQIDDTKLDAWIGFTAGVRF